MVSGVGHGEQVYQVTLQVLLRGEHVVMVAAADTSLPPT
jgi:hypothetical protein